MNTLYHGEIVISKDRKVKQAKKFSRNIGKFFIMKLKRIVRMRIQLFINVRIPIRLVLFVFLKSLSRGFRKIKFILKFVFRTQALETAVKRSFTITEQKESSVQIEICWMN